MARLTKTQKEFRKKMKKLAANGELKDEFGNPIKVKYYSPFNARNIIIAIFAVCVILRYASPFIYMFFMDNIEYMADEQTKSVSSVHQYTTDLEMLYEPMDDTEKLMELYSGGQQYSIADITAAKGKFTQMLTYIEAGEQEVANIKECAIEVVDAHIAMLNFLEKNLGLEKMTEAEAEYNAIADRIEKANDEYNISITDSLRAAANSGEQIN